MRRGLTLLGTAIVLACAAAPAYASPFIHAHRGGAVVDGVPTYPENTMEAFRASAAEGFVLEADALLTKDRVPVIIHDSTLDRTTDCTGQVKSKTLTEVRGCTVDVLGSGGKTAPDPTPTEAVPTLDELLDFAAESGARLNLEIKNVPTDPGFEVGTDFAQIIVDAVVASDVPRADVIIQSFWPEGLEVAEAAGLETSLLTLEQMNPGAPAFAKARGYEWISPGYSATGLPAAVVSKAHALGLRVVPYTLNDAVSVTAAVKAGVDEIITDDPTMARAAVRAAFPGRPSIPAAPTATECAALPAVRGLPTVTSSSDRGGPRVFAMQFKQDGRHVATYETFRTKIECMVLEHVVPHLAIGRPNVIAFNEDIGLATIATGTRGHAARDAFARPGAPSCEPDGVPCGTFAALAAIRAGYSAQLAAYRARFPAMGAIGDSFVAPTDTFARGWMQVFSDIARRYGVYILGSNNQAPFRESIDPVEIAKFADPDLPSRPGSVFVATSPNAYNEVFMWGPEDVREEGPWPARNIVASNKKVPLTSIEILIEISPGASTGPDAIANLRPYALPGTDARIGFATSLPAFVFGPESAEPCADVSRTYMRCLDALGTNLVMQDEANPGRWTANGGGGYWQPLEWMASTWRQVADPTVSFDYNVTPHMVGNLADLAFDGQTAITQRGGTAGPGCHYVGNSTLLAGDPAGAAQYAGPKTEFLALLPWVTPDAPRDELTATGAKLRPGSGDPLENDYLEGAIAADLPFPPDTSRGGCAGAG